MSWKEVLADALGCHTQNLVLNPCSGGSINQSFELKLGDGQRYFVKHLSHAPANFFEAEAQGLETLKKLSPIRVPNIINHHPQFLCLEWITPMRPRGDFFERFGQALAEQHRQTTPSWGFGQHNFIGSLKQHNSPEDTFIDFFWEQRLLPQIQQCDLLTSQHYKQFEILSHKLDKLINTPEESPALIHGDLWSGNFLCDINNNPVLIDPAVAYSHREMELAFTEMFGGYSGRFYKAYDEAFPLSPNYDDRRDIYNLYPLMVHVNLFGGSYLVEVESVLNRYC